MGIIFKIFGFIKNKLQLPSFLQLKVLIPAITLICSTIFGSGMFVQNEINKVQTARMEQKYLEEIKQLKEHNANIDKLMQESSSDRQQITVVITYIDYILSVSDFFQNRTLQNMEKSNLYRDRFVNYLKVYSGKQDIKEVPFFDIDGVLLPVKVFKLYMPTPKKD